MPEPLKIAIFIPAYNAAFTLPLVLDRIPAEIKEKVKEIFVIDNASEDHTHLIGIGYREAKGLDKLEVFRNESNRGYGGDWFGRSTASERPRYRGQVPKRHRGGGIQHTGIFVPAGQPCSSAGALRGRWVAWLSGPHVVGGTNRHGRV